MDQDRRRTPRQDQTADNFVNGPLDIEGEGEFAAANIRGTRILTDIDHNDANDFDLDLRQRILARIIDTINEASTR